MSRLIFEGDTTDRFGKLFPKPFISEVRIYENKIESDVLLFLEVSLDDNEAAKEVARTSRRLRVNGNFFDQQQFNEVLNPNFTGENSDFYKNSFFALNFNQNDFVRTNPLINIEYHYNSKGKRFAEALITFTYRNYDSFLALDRNRYFGAFTSFISPASELGASGNSGRNALLQAFEGDEKNLFHLLKNQTSDYCYERILNPDNSVNTDIQILYQEEDGNYYGDIPMQSLDRSYRKTNNVTFESVLNYISPIIEPYIGSAEGDRISTTLSQNTDNPKLLLLLEQDVNSFSNKSSATAQGAFYNELVRAITDVDKLLQAEEVLKKREVTNSKVKDYRSTSTTGDTTRFTEDTTEHLGRGTYSRYRRQYIYAPLVDYGLIKINRVPSSTLEIDDFMIARRSFHFFDYAKALNYVSSISKFLNPYNILEVYGQNCLNKYFKIKQVRLGTTNIGDPTNSTDFVNCFRFQIDNPPQIPSPENPSTIPQFQVEDVNRQGNVSFQIVDKGSSPTDKIVDTYFIERSFDTGYGMDGYRLRCFEAQELFKPQIIQPYHQMSIGYVIEDSTMEFYDIHIRQKIFQVFETYERYYELSREFCSYNDLDGKFNDFFVNFVESDFENPYPWIEGPTLYYLFFELLTSSRKNNSPGGATYGGTQISNLNFEEAGRRREGSAVNMGSLSDRIRRLIASVSPRTANVDSIEKFYLLFKELKVIFEKGNGLDSGNLIYKVNTSTVSYGYELIQSSIDRSNSVVYKDITQISDSYEVIPLYRPRSGVWSLYSTYEPEQDFDYIFKLSQELRARSTNSETNVFTGEVIDLQIFNDKDLTWEKLYTTNPYNDQSIEVIRNISSTSNNYVQDQQAANFTRKHWIPAFLKAKEISQNNDLTLKKFLFNNEDTEGSIAFIRQIYTDTEN